MCLADIIATFLAIFCGGILILGYSATPPECTNLCEGLVTLLAGAYQVTVACLFFAVSYVPTLSQRVCSGSFESTPINSLIGVWLFS